MSQPYDLEYSTNLNAWTFLKRVVPTASPVTVTDDTIGANMQRFYRAKVVSSP